MKSGVRTRSISVSVSLTALSFAIPGAAPALGALASDVRSEPGRFEYLARVWDTDYGLPDYAVNGFAQTRDGYLWVATNEGLARFDGARFILVNHDTTPEFPSKAIWALTKDRSDEIWTATSAGIVAMAGGHWRTYPESGNGNGSGSASFAATPEGGFLMAGRNRMVRMARGRTEDASFPEGAASPSVFQAFDGSVWMHDAHHVWQWRGESWQRIGLPASLAAGGVRGVGPGYSGIWIAGSSSVVKLNRGVWGSAFSVPDGLRLNRPTKLMEDSQGNVWVGDPVSGLLRFRPDGKVLRFTAADGLYSPAIRALFEDREGNVWVGTHGGGMVRFRRRAARHFAGDEGLRELMVDTVAEDGAGRLMLGTYGGSLVRFDESASRFGAPWHSGLIGERSIVGSVIEDRAGGLWAAVRNAGILHLGPGGPAGAVMENVGGFASKVLFSDSKGTLWIGTESGVAAYIPGRVVVYGESSGLEPGGISAIAEDADGDIWIGGERGLFRFHAGRFDKFPSLGGRELGPVTCLYGGAAGLWIGTENGGLFRRRDSGAVVYTPAEGFPVVRVTGIMQDDGNRLWMATFQDGLLCIPLESFDAVDARRAGMLNLIRLKDEDGLGTNQFRSGYQPTIRKGHDGRLWFATLKGLVMVDPRRVRRDPMPQSVLMESAAGGGHSVAMAGSHPAPLLLPAGSRRLRFRYTAPTFASPEKARFQYRLEPLDAAWLETSERSVDYGEVKPGHYVFRVRAGNGDGVWNPDEASLAVGVAPYVWETWWFRLLGACTIAFVAASVTYSGQRKKLERRTTQLRIEQQLRRDVEDLQAVLTVSEERFAKAFNASPNILSIATLAEGRLVDVNRRFLQTTGMRREAVIGRTFAELGDNAGAALVARLRGDLAHGPVRGLDVEVRDREGVPRSLIVSAETIELGGVQHVLLISDDVTERKLLEHQISHARKIETTGRLAGGIAHDFNNLLTVINGYSDLVLKLAGLEPKTRERVRQIRQAGERAAELTRQLLAFSRKQVAVPKAIDLNAVVKETEAMLHRLMPENIEMITRLDPAPGLIMADPGQMNQVLLNLALNARDAMPAGGRLIVETGRVFLDRDYAAAHAEVTAGECVLLAVTDTGTGMDDSVRSHIFEPYFTTKEAGSGTGLGLASVYGIVRQSRGWIWVYSEPGSGTTFKIYFPRLSSPALEPDGPPPAARILTGTETIVLVEDRDDVRAFAGEVLESAGYTVLQASNGASALDLAVRYDGPIHLLLTDIVMPGMDGPDLQARVAAARGPIQVLFMSGYTERMVSNQALMQSGAAFIEKPLTPDILLRKVREVLGGPALEGCL